MNHRSLKVFVSCALGGGIGTLVSLQIHPYLWWIGLFVGGLVGYFSYEFKAVLQALVQAWKATINWRPDVKKLPKFLEAWFWDFVFYSNFALPFLVYFIMCLSIWYIFVEKKGIGDIIIDSSPLYATILSFSSFCVPFLLFWSGSLLFDEYTETKGVNLAGHRKRGLTYNALTISFWHGPRAFVWISVRVHLPFVAGAKILRHSFLPCGRFGWHFFRLIHSDIRLLCGIDAMIGAAVGYFTGSALIGAAVGGIVGVLNFEIFSKRIFHFVPVANSS